MRSPTNRAAEMPFLDHLEELRWRIIWSVLAVAVAVACGFYLVLHYNVIHRLEAPILPFLSGHRLIATHPTDGLQLTISAAMWIGVVFAFPVIVYQAWLFLAPALYRREKRMLGAALASGILLFVAGGAFAFRVVLPTSLPFLFDLFGTGLEPMITAENYFGMVVGMVLSFGMAFELPVVVLLLAAAGLVTPQMLGRYRRHAFVLIVAISAFLTPGDFVWSTLALAGPLYLLYELSVVASHIVVKYKPANSASLALLLAPLALLRRRAVQSASA